MRDVPGGSGTFAVLVEPAVEAAASGPGELQRAEAVRAAVDDRVDARRQLDRRAWARRMARPQLGNRGVGTGNPLDRQFDFASRRFAIRAASAH